MSTILPFPIQDRWPRDRPGLRKRGAPWRAIDLKGKPPKGHRSPAYGPRGKAILDIGQVWVEYGSQELWVINDLTRVDGSFYPLSVVMGRYRSKGREQRPIRETTLRYQMCVWDKFESERMESVRKLQRVAGQDPVFARQSAGDANPIRTFFGLDAEGYRID